MAKKNKSFLPKRIAGVKVPKSVRKGRFGELMASPAGLAAIAEALRRHDDDGGEELAPASAEGWTERSAHDGAPPSGGESKKKPAAYPTGPV